MVIDAIDGKPGPMFCTTLAGTKFSIVASVIPAVHCVLLLSFIVHLQLLLEVVSPSLFLYVYFTNRRIHAQWVNHNQTLPIRVSLRRNMDIAGALITPGLVRVVCNFCIYAILISVYLFYRPAKVPLLQHVSCRKAKRLCNVQLPAYLQRSPRAHYRHL